MNKLIAGFFACGVMALAAWTLPAMAADTLCPDVQAEKEGGPANVAGVQADIERLTLCVERAKLLKQLDDIAKQREDMLKKITDPAASLTSTIAGVGGLGIPGMPSASLPPLPTDVSGLKAGDVRVIGAAANPLAGGAGTAPAAPVSRGWKVRKIWGQGAMMRAQLTDGGTLLNVVKGDTLPDGKVVDAVSIKGVAVSQNGKTTDLSWDDSSTGETATSNAYATPPQ